MQRSQSSLRWPLRLQIVAPLAVVTVATVVALAAFQAVSASRRSQARIENQLAGVVRTLLATNFPLTQPVLEQMKGLSGADFVVETPLGATFSTIELSTRDIELPREGTDFDRWEIALRDLIQFQDRMYFHAPLRLANRRGVGEQPLLHLLYAEDEYRRAQWEAVAPSAALGSVAVLATVLCGVWIARNVCQTVSRIGLHVERIAEGDFRPVPVPVRNDELSDLAANVNLMADRLVEFEGQVRRTEQLRTLGQLGAGLAHEIRNSATGSRMALQIHAEECPLGADCESLQVAARQLRLIETCVQRFLRLSKPSEGPAHQRVNLGQLVEEVAPLVKPHARHLGITLECDSPAAAVSVRGDPESLGQVLLNLLFNAIEAVSSPQDEAVFTPQDHVKGEQIVTIRVSQQKNRAIVAVEDHGAGPSDALGEKLFDPFVSDKADGVGLGLSVSREIVQDHGGTIEWKRTAGTTHFLVNLPLENEETPVAEPVGH